MNRYNFSAKTLEDAITKATVELGVTSDRLEYVITEQGSNGVFGIGARPWVISACSKDEIEAEAEKERREAEKAAQNKAREEAAAKAAHPEAAAGTARTEDGAKAARKENTGKTAGPENTGKTAGPENTGKASRPETGKEKGQQDAEHAVFRPAAEAGEAAAKAETFLHSVFESMGMEVAMKSEYDEVLGELTINLSGDDMGVLIGKRGQTLDSLQYLAGQVANKHSSDYIRIKLDTENYRERRKEALETLAHNMAQKVRRTRHAMALEPMNPYERRIIHSTLQEEKDIITRSEGEEPYRHVVVCFVKHKK